MTTTIFNAWWHGLAALPLSRNEQAYYALRRIWADQTINTQSGSRSYYRWGTEDHITPALWQHWYIFDNPSVLEPFLRLAGARVGSLQRAQWAYACEELTGVGKKFVTPDIMVQYEDEAGLGLLAIEAKRPGISAKAEDAEKLRQYCRLPSTRGMRRVAGCFLVSESCRDTTTRATANSFPIVSWEELARAQIAGLGTIPDVERPTVALIKAWVERGFARFGVAPKCEAPPPAADQYGTAEGYAAFDRLSLPTRLALFLKGSECVEVAWNGGLPDAPMKWMIEEPSRSDVVGAKFQSTADRRVCRWTCDWKEVRELSRR